MAIDQEDATATGDDEGTAGDKPEEGEPSTPEGEEKPDQQPEESDEVKGLKARAYHLAEKNRQLMDQIHNPKEQERIDPLEDPEGFERQQEERLTKTEQRITLTVSERFARSRYDDFDAKIDVFEDLVEQNPILKQQMMNSDDPAEFAYQAADQHLIIKEMGDPETMREKIRSEERQKLEAGFEERLEAELKRRQHLPGSLADTRAAGSDSANVDAKDDSLDDVLK